jgi:hypothetical protein
MLNLRAQPIYVEARIDADLDELWSHTQDPACHERWDLRFTRIRYIDDRKFRYASRVLPGLLITGTGVAVGERRRPDGTSTCALRFASDHPLSLIRAGAGYWRYVPTGAQVRFLTGYDYQPGWGPLGSIADLAFRPIFGWATAWTFDRLRLWLERGIDPRRALWQGLGELCLRTVAIAAAATTGPWWLVVAVAALALVLPPAPTTPAARRCRRRPPDRLSTRPPSTLDTLESPL